KETEMVESGGDVGYLNLKSLELVDKGIPESKSQMELVLDADIRRPEDFLDDLKLAEEEQQAEDQAKELHLDDDHESPINRNNSFDADIISPEVCDNKTCAIVHHTSTGFSFATSFTGATVEEAILKLK
ncbi:hypothetical protein SK128_019023, partial [Halocaridina rubra]